MHQLARESHSLQGDFSSAGFPLSAATITTRQAFPSLSESKARHQWRVGVLVHKGMTSLMTPQFTVWAYVSPVLPWRLSSSAPRGLTSPCGTGQWTLLVNYGKHFPGILSTSPLCGNVETSHLHVLIQVSQHRCRNYCHLIPISPGWKELGVGGGGETDPNFLADLGRRAG